MSSDKRDVTDFEKDPLLLDHDYDGIQELDNPLPGWWQTTFYVTIIFSFIYFIHYHTGAVPDSSAELAAEMKVIRAQQVAAEKSQVPVPVQNIAALISDSKALALGQAEYSSRCAACHGQKGEGLIGPNLTDRYWIHGKGSPEEIVKVIQVGVPEKGMPAWQSLIPAEKMAPLAAYVASLKGLNPPGGKAPEGTPVEN